MARRRRPQAPAPAPVLEIPEHLATWFLDDWVSADEDVRATLLDPPPITLLERGFARAVTSRRRFVAARRDWAAQLQAKGVQPPPFPPVGRPRRRPSQIEVSP